MKYQSFTTASQLLSIVWCFLVVPFRSESLKVSHLLSIFNLPFIYKKQTRRTESIGINRMTIAARTPKREQSLWCMMQNKTQNVAQRHVTSFHIHPVCPGIDMPSLWQWHPPGGAGRVNVNHLVAKELFEFTKKIIQFSGIILYFFPGRTQFRINRFISKLL